MHLNNQLSEGLLCQLNHTHGKVCDALGHSNAMPHENAITEEVQQVVQTKCRRDLELWNDLIYDHAGK